MANAGRSRQLSVGSLNALLLALGLSPSDLVLEESGNTETSNGNPLCASEDSLRALSQSPLAAFSKMDPIELDDILILDREVFSFFDVCSNQENTDFGPYSETLPSRPGSSLERIETGSSRAVNQHHFYQTFPSRTTSLDHCRVRKNHIDVKAAHNATIIMLRVPRDIRLADLKLRLYDKFVKQENILLSRSFSIVLALPPQPSPARPRREYRRMSLANCTEMQFIDREADWREITATNDGRKINLRILDTQP